MSACGSLPVFPLRGMFNLVLGILTQMPWRNIRELNLLFFALVFLGRAPFLWLLCFTFLSLFFMLHTGDKHPLKQNSNNANFHNNNCVIYKIYYTHIKTIYMIKTIISIHKLNKSICDSPNRRHNVFIIR